MRKILILSALVLTLAGCAWVKEQVGYFQYCSKDEVCWTQSIEKSKSIGDKAGDLASLSPVPGSSKVVESVVGYASLIFFLIQGGKKLRKKDELNP